MISLKDQNYDDEKIDDLNVVIMFNVSTFYITFSFHTQHSRNV